MRISLIPLGLLLSAISAILMMSCASAKAANKPRPTTTTATTTTTITIATGHYNMVLAAANPFVVGPISHYDRWLTDAAGRVVLLHGVNMVEKRPPYYPSAFGFGNTDAAWLASNGLYVVRLGVLATGLMPSPGHIDTTYLNNLATTVQSLTQHHIFVLLDFHQDAYGPSVGFDGFPAWMTLTNGAPNRRANFPVDYLTNPAVQQAFKSFWDNEKVPGGLGLQQYYAAMLTAVAARFGANPWVLGYDILNEPWPGKTAGICLINASGCPTLDHKELDPFYKTADHAARLADHTHIVFVEPFVLFNQGLSRTNISLPGNDPNSGLSFHQYALTTSQAQQVLTNAISWSQLTGGALLNTEWGGTTNPVDIAAESSQIDSAMLPWIYWSFNGGVVSNLSLPPTGTNLNQGVASTLVQPYPLAIAGTPKTLSYDASSHILNFTWSTRGVDGKVFTPNAITSFVVPKLDYPTGYNVIAHGVTVTSNPCAPLMTVTAASGATALPQNVSVEITPGQTC